MILLVLGVILLLTMVLVVLGAIVAVVVIRGCWSVVRPIAVAGLLLLAALAFLDALASNHTVRCAEEGEPGMFAPGKTLHRAPHDAAAASPPAWILRKPGEMNTAQEVVEITVHAGPCLSLPDCEAQLEKELVRTVEDYVRAEIAQAPGADVTVPPQFIEEALVKGRYVARNQREVLASRDPEEMVELYALVKIDRDDRTQLLSLWRESVVHQRIKAAGGLLVGILAVLSLGWAILRRPPRPTVVRTG